MTPTQADHEAAAADLFAAIENADHHASNADCRAAGEDLSQACPLAEAHKIRAIVLIAAALAEAVRVAPAHSDDSGRESDATKHARDCLCVCHKTDAAHNSNVGCQRELVRVAVEKEREACARDRKLHGSKTVGALSYLLGSIASWTSSRWDQHLRWKFGDEFTDHVLNVLLHFGVPDPRPARSDAQATPAPEAADLGDDDYVAGQQAEPDPDLLDALKESLHRAAPPKAGEEREG